MEVKATTADAYKLFHDGALAMADITANGIKIDEDKLHNNYRKLGVKIKHYTKKLDQYEEIKKWKKKYGKSFNLDSDDQLRDILFNEFDYEPYSHTETGQEAVNQEALNEIGIPFAKEIIYLNSLKQTRNTFLKNIINETNKGFLHPHFNLNFAISFRSSSSSINFQNLPSRDKEMAKIAKDCFIPREGGHLVEIDYDGIEVAASAMLHRDPQFIYDITHGDMHTDVAKQIFWLDELDKHATTHEKNMRYATKNGFVFPQFYGDYYGNNAIALWNNMDYFNLHTRDGVPIRKHLKKHGIKNFKAFENHIKEIENDFWNNRFPVYKKWKDQIYEEYTKTGKVGLPTGFDLKGVMEKKLVTNYPIQGCLEGNSLVLTDQGQIPIKDLVGRNVRVWTGFKWADAIGLDRGKCQRANIKLSSGLTIKCDTRHELKNNFHEWISFDQLSVGDKICLPKTTQAISPSNEMTWEFVLGFIIGDGALCKRKRSENYTRKHLMISVTKRKLETLEKIRDYLTELGYKGYNELNIKRNSRKKNHNDLFRLVVEDKNFTRDVENEGIEFGVNAQNKYIPTQIWKKSFRKQRDFLEGIWASDGTKGKWQEGNLHMCNLNLLKEIQILSYPLGFDSYIKPTYDGWIIRFSCNEKNRKPIKRKIPSETMHNFVNTYDIKVNNNDAITERRLMKSGNDVSQYVGERIFEKYSDTGEVYRYDEIESIEILDEEETTYTMSVNDHLHQFVADGVVHKNTAFHILLWSCIRPNHILKTEGWRSKIVGQIHDSLMIDVPSEELNDLLVLANRVMTKDIAEEWDFINVDLGIEADATPLNRPWSEKESIEIPN